MADKSIAEQYKGWCKHFNGIQNDACKAGVRYADLVPEEFGRARKLPCFRSTKTPSPCALCIFPTDAEAEQYERDALDRNAKFMTAIIEGKCPVCNLPVTQRQVGHCVYGSCGHRLYQGKVMNTAKPEATDATH